MATVYFKERIATRRQADVFHWQNIYNGSTLYEHDTIRTSVASQATIHFFDGTELDIFESSIIRLGSLTSDQIAMLERGSVNVSNNGNMTKSISVAGKILNLFSNTKALISGSADGSMNIEVQNGEAILNDGKKEIKLKQLQVAHLLENGNGTSVQDLTMAPLYPASNKKYMLSDKTQEIPFTFASNDIKNVKLVIASDEDFRNIYKVIEDFQKTSDANVYTCKSELKSKKAYWKLVSGNGEESEVMEISTYEVPELSHIFPSANAQITQTSSDKKIKFSWNKLEGAKAYVFEISKHEDFRNVEVKKVLTNTSTHVEIEKEGDYYWRVSPQYEYESLADIQATANKFSVKKTDKLNATKPIFPVNNYKVKLADIESNGLSFSWLPERTAKQYTVNFYEENSQLPSETYLVENTLLDIKNIKTKLFNSPKKIFWSISYHAEDGRNSPESVRNVLHIIDKPVLLTSVFPQDNYVIADSLMHNVRFTWEDKSKSKNLFLIASDPDFNNILIKKACQSTSYFGAYLKSGTYYWKVQSLDDEGTVLANTEVRSFKVIPNLDSVLVTEPKNRITVPLLKSVIVNLKFLPVKYADYYELSVYSPKGKRILYQPFSDGRSVSISVGNYEEGTYKITLQAFAADTMAHTKNTGLITLHEFNSKEIDFIKLLLPEDMKIISGVSAFNEGLRFAWISDPSLKEGSTFELMKNGRVIRSRTVSQNGRVNIALNDLKEGAYTWRVLSVFNGYEVSSKKENRFTILPIEPLKTPHFIEEKQSSLINVEYFKNKRFLYFEWTAVDFADYYLFRIKDDMGKSIFEKQVKSTSLKLDDLSMLYIAGFTATVQAVSKSRLRGVTSLSEEGTYFFKVDLPKIVKPQNAINGRANYYGF